MKNKINRACKPAMLGMFLGSLTYQALAASDFSLIAGVGLEAHDNAGLTSSNEESDTKRLVNADIGYKKDDGPVNIDLDYRVEYGNYVHDVQGDNTAVDGKASVKGTLLPRSLDVVFYNQISQQKIDRRGLDVSSNLENRSVTTAGLDGYLHLSNVDSVVLSPRFTNVHFQDTDSSDSQRSSMVAAWNHRISEVSSLDLSANYAHVTFDDSANDYDSPGVILSFRTALSRTSYQVGVGATRLNRDNGEDITEPMARAAIDYRGDEGQDWGASFIHQVTDSSIGLSGVELSLDKFQSNDSNFSQFDIIEESKVDAYWHNRISASSLLSLGIGYQKQDYQDTPQDQNVAYVQAGYQYTINSRWSTGIDGRFERDKFLDDPKQEYDNTRIYVNATYRPLRPLEIRFSVGQDKRNADTSAASYTDKVAIIGFRYRFF